MSETQQAGHGAVAGQVERGVRPLAHQLASQLQNAAYNCGYEDTHPSNATTRQDKADAKAREKLAALYAEIDKLAADAERFRWLAERTAATGLERWVHPFQFLAEAVDERKHAGATHCD